MYVRPTYFSTYNVYVAFSSVSSAFGYCVCKTSDLLDNYCIKRADLISQSFRHFISPSKYKQKIHF